MDNNIRLLNFFLISVTLCGTLSGHEDGSLAETVTYCECRSASSMAMQFSYTPPPSILPHNSANTMHDMSYQIGRPIIGLPKHDRPLCIVKKGEFQQRLLFTPLLDSNICWNSCVAVKGTGVFFLHLVTCMPWLVKIIKVREVHVFKTTCLNRKVQRDVNV